MGILEQQDGIVWGMSCFWPSIGVHQMNTCGSSCHTPAAHMIKWLWLDILYLMHVLYVAIGAPPFTSLGSKMCASWLHAQNRPPQSSWTSLIYKTLMNRQKKHFSTFWSLSGVLEVKDVLYRVCKSKRIKMANKMCGCS